jgi:hypothetical protein
MPAVGTLSEFRDRVRVKIGEITTPHLIPSDAATDLAIESGLSQYQQLRPRVFVKESAGDGTTRRYVCSTYFGADYDPDFSQIVQVQRVLNLDLDNETVDDSIAWEVRVNATDGHVLFLDSVIGNGNHMRTRYTVGHTIDETDSADTTVPDTDTDLLTCLCASYLAYWVARKAGDLAITEMGITEINFRRLREHWADRAKELLSEAGEFMSPTNLPVQSAGASVQWATLSNLIPDGRISHRER